MKRLRRHVQDTLSEVLGRVRWEGPPRRAVAASKTVKQLARPSGAAAQRKGPFVTRELTVAALRERIPQLTEATAADRPHLRGISRSRARQAGVLGAEGALSVEVCPCALREGIMLRHLERIAETPALLLLPLTRHPDARARPLHPSRNGRRLPEQSGPVRCWGRRVFGPNEPIRTGAPMAEDRLRPPQQQEPPELTEEMDPGLGTRWRTTRTAGSGPGSRR
ncbi:hypothetical protein QRX50_29195 [Amycolatopsis carbonis]|uniref:Ppx/GppA phosphatase N-terminal domain-containing protein n=1 Tax=Amycolatopsis carbonis TaxID=715471 RepID=A0A9Y2I874_9PSEU|nr:hypothetical protein [Amycolatopsis sp. 2-15]WIX75575.1 hypothetical protein QRX50_29195 [Amycolatopsis sp. 2-15]